MSARAIAAVVFDMDGTLLDSLDAQIESYRRAILDFGGRDRPYGEILDAFALGPAANMLAVLIERPVGDEAVTRYEAHLRERAGHVRPYAGVADALSELSTHVRLGVFTAADTNAANILLGRSGIHSFFGAVVGADRVARTKPAPDGMILACATLGVRPEEAAYVGDGPSDVKVARACGAIGIAAGWGHQFTADREADAVAATPDALVRLLIGGPA